jgi:integrase
MADRPTGNTRRRRELTDEKIRALKPAPAGKRYIEYDGLVGGFGIRVTSAGHKSFVLVARFPGSGNPVPRTIGAYAPLTPAEKEAAAAAYLALPEAEKDGLTYEAFVLKKYGPRTLHGARETARQWVALIDRDKDPAEEKRRAAAAAQMRRANSFRAVAEDFIAEKLAVERKGSEVARDLRSNFVEPLGGRPVTEITTEEIASIVKAKARSAPAQARNLLGTAKRFFQWAVDQHAYGLAINPAAALKPKALCGEKTERSRKLDDDELFAFLRAVRRLPYPYGPIYRLLVLAGLRLNEVARAGWVEFSKNLVRAIEKRKPDATIDWSTFSQKDLTWIIPASRMKGKNGKARDHAVPITRGMLAVFESLRVYEDGDFLFSTTAGRRPAWISDKIKKTLDARMLRTLRALARKRGDNPAKVKLPHWQNHDLRRVVRSGLSRLRIASEVAEAVLAHTPTGIQKVYDVHDYLDEKREALEAWALHLRAVVEPPPQSPPSNVVQLVEAARA